MNQFGSIQQRPLHDIPMYESPIFVIEVKIYISFDFLPYIDTVT